MKKKVQSLDTIKQNRTIKDIVNTPFKKAMFVVQVISYVLIVGSPAIGGGVGAVLGMSGKNIGILILIIFITGEVLFYGSLIFLGKEILLLIKEKTKAWFKRKNQGCTKSNKS